MKLISNELRISNLQWSSIFCLFVAVFLGLLGISADWEVTAPMLTLLVGFSIGIQATRIFREQELRISELERKAG